MRGAIVVALGGKVKRARRAQRARLFPEIFSWEVCGTGLRQGLGAIRLHAHPASDGAVSTRGESNKGTSTRGHSSRVAPVARPCLTSRDPITTGDRCGNWGCIV